MRIQHLPALLVAAVALVAPTSANAETIGPWSLNATLCGGPPMPGSCVAGAPWGSVSLTDNADPERVDVTVTLVDPAVIRDVWLNFFDTFFDLSGDLTFTMLANIGSGTLSTVNASLDGEQADGYGGNYDLNIPIPGHNPSTSLTITLCSGVDPQGGNPNEPSFCDDTVDLDAADFNFQDELGLTHIAILRNSAGGQDPVPNFLMDTTAPAPVPEPGSLVLLGSGLAIAARRFRRRK